MEIAHSRRLFSAYATLRNPPSVSSGSFLLHHSVLGRRFISVGASASLFSLARDRVTSVLANAHSGISEAAVVDVRDRVQRAIEGEQFFRMFFPRAAFVEVPCPTEVLDADEPHLRLIGQSPNQV